MKKTIIINVTAAHQYSFNWCIAVEIKWITTIIYEQDFNTLIILVQE